ncbi:probable protein disulfide isomerase-like 2-2 [Coccomyxa sp. Obi]|nr:probable protein disulfide isomerase-like 2-2 [Coccomyxa sp. Obi]
MRTVLALLLSAAVATLVVSQEDPTESLSGVYDLTPADFDKVVNGGKHALVEFYAPWCGHCKHLTPEYKKLGEAVAKDPKLKNSVVIAKVNADDHREIGEKFGVRGFPTIKFFGRGKPTTSPEDYQGGRTSEAFLGFLHEKVAADKGFARIGSLDTLARDFLAAADKTGAAAALKTAAEKLEEAQRAAGMLYSKFAEKAAAKGGEFFKTETARLERLLESGKVGANKAAEISQKLSVLTAFSPDDDEEEEATKEKLSAAEE